MSEAVLGPVVIGYEGTPSGADAITLGQWCARLLGVPAVVAVVHPAPAVIGPGRVDAEWVADRHRLAEELLDRARGLVGDDGGGAAGAVEYRVVSSSSAAHGLHDLAEELSAALIVVGSRAAGPRERLFAGSTADRLLSGSGCPVAVAPGGLHERPSGAPTRIGVAYVDTPDARAALTFATALARRSGTVLRLYTVVAAEAEVMPLFVGMDAEQAFTTRARESFQRALDEALAGLPPEVKATGQLLVGHVVDTLAELGPDDIDLLVCGSRGYGPALRVMLGGVSTRLVRAARSPVVVVPRPG
jgi:nucleotide-binding universal stress UspA family protein